MNIIKNVFKIIMSLAFSGLVVWIFMHSDQIIKLFLIPFGMAGIFIAATVFAELFNREDIKKIFYKIYTSIFMFYYFLTLVFMFIYNIKTNSYQLNLMVAIFLLAGVYFLYILIKKK